MLPELRYYQTEAADWVRDREWRERFRTVLQAPTGSGKTIIMADLLLDPSRQIVFTHRLTLLEQLSGVLKSYGIPHTFRASGRAFDPDAPICLAMIQTELKRGKRMPTFQADRVHIDERHVMKGAKYQSVFDDYYRRGANEIGYTATPYNLDPEKVDDVHEVVSIPELIEQGYLCPPRVFSCGQPDIKALEKLRRDSSGEYMAGDVNKLIRPNVIFGQVKRHLRRLNPDGRPFVLFAHSVKASLWWAEKLTWEGIPTAHIDGADVWIDGKFYKSDDVARGEAFAMINDGRLRGLSNRFVLREGIDLPIIGHAILTCPVGLRSSFVQMCGRVLRPYKDREYAIIQDHSGSAILHPPLDGNWPWDWRKPPGLAERQYIGGMKGEEIREPIMCPECHGLRNAGDTCPFCGYRYAKHARYVLESNGTLRLYEGRQFKHRRPTIRPGQGPRWERVYWAAVKNRPGDTFEQLYARYAWQNDWEWLPRNLPLMPKRESDWFLPVSEVPGYSLVPRPT